MSKSTLNALMLRLRRAEHAVTLKPTTANRARVARLQQILANAQEEQTQLLTLTEVRAALKTRGMVISYFDGEYRVAPARGKDAYYTNDLRDALDTGFNMADEALAPKFK